MKRFTDTEKWDDIWFQDLPSKYQKFWIYICDKCDCAGIWKVNKPLAEFQLKQKIDLEEALQFFNNGKQRIKKLTENKWFITGFITFQVTTLRRLDKAGNINRVHSPIYASLEANGLDPSLYEMEGNRGSTEALESLLTRQEQDKEKDNKALEKKKDTEKEKHGIEGLVLLTRSECVKLYTQLGERKTAEYIQKLENYIGSKGKRYKSHYHTILSWWANDGKPKSDLNLNKTQTANLEVLDAFVRKRKGTPRPEDLRPGDGSALVSVPGV